MRICRSNVNRRQAEKNDASIHVDGIYDIDEECLRANKPEGKNYIAVAVTATLLMMLTLTNQTSADGAGFPPYIR